MNTSRLIAIGDNVTDCYVQEKIYYPGGNALNVAVNAKRNGFDHVAYIGIFGNDSHSDHIRSSLAAENIDVHLSRQVYAHTAQPRVTINSEGDRVFQAGPLRSAQHLFKVSLTKEELEQLSSYSVCHTSCYSSLEDSLPIIKESCPISFDFSQKLDEDYLKKVCPHLTFSFFSAPDGLSVIDIKALIEKIHSFGSKYVCCTMGSKGSLFFDGSRFYEQPIKPIEVVDTMGAGDSFIAGFLTAFITHNKDITQSLNYAATVAAHSCTVAGSFGYPHPFDQDTLV
jgi:fructoselysine 6-kinase